MYRYTLTVPANENDGSSLAILHEGISQVLADQWHAFGAFPGDGGWFEPEWPAIREPIIVYVVDVSEDAPDSLEWFQALARRVRRTAAQDAVYLTRQLIETWLIV